MFWLLTACLSVCLYVVLVLAVLLIRPHKRVSVDGHRLSVRRLRMEGRSKLKIVKKEAHDTSDPRSHLEVERSQGRLTP